jgi:hypothetical protein
VDRSASLIADRTADATVDQWWIALVDLVHWSMVDGLHSRKGMRSGMSIQGSTAQGRWEVLVTGGEEETEQRRRSLPEHRRNLGIRATKHGFEYGLNLRLAEEVANTSMTLVWGLG